MPKIANGTITLSRKVRDGEYAGRDATVSLSFNTEDGEGSVPGDYIDYVGVLVANKVQSMLGLPATASQLSTAKAPAEASDLETATIAAAIGKAPTTRKKAAAASPAKGLPEGAISLEEAKERVAAPQTDKDGKPFSPTNPITAGKIDLDATSLEAPALKPITDAELVSAINRKVEEISDASPIRALIDNFDKDHKPGVSRNIPADARRNFLVQLAALKKSVLDL